MPGIAAAGGVTNVIFSTPISTLTTGAVVTVTPSQSRRVYQVSASTPITLTNNLTALGANCTTNYEWETWINYTVTNALSTVWDSRIQWAQQTPDLTVTGLYKFAMSTACGTVIQARQTYPTVNETHIMAIGVKNSTVTSEAAGFSRIDLLAATDTSATIIGVALDPARPTIATIKLYAGGVAPTWLTNTYVAVGWTYFLASAVNGAYYVTTNSIPTNSALCADTKFYVPPPSNYAADGNFRYIFNVYRTGTNNTVRMNVGKARYANELETAAYNAGWRP
jgi:hypothetical protein